MTTTTITTTTYTRLEAVKYFLSYGSLTDDAFISVNGTEYTLTHGKTERELGALHSKHLIKDYLTQDHVICLLSDLNNLDQIAGQIEVIIIDNY